MAEENEIQDFLSILLWTEDACMALLCGQLWCLLAQ